MNIDKATSTIQLTQIYLKESIFKRGDSLNASFSLKINTHTKRDGNKFEVSVNVVLESKEDTFFACSVTTTGLFSINGEFPKDQITFERINAPAIIYPYVRHHIRNLSIESGLNPILIPIVNFESLYKQDSPPVQ